MIKIELKDGIKKDYPKGFTVSQVANDISKGLARVALAGEFEGQIVDLNYSLNENGHLKILTFDDRGGKEAFWHTSSHIMAQAVKRLFPEAKLAIGPAINNGFYYDFDVDRPFTPEDIELIENEMKKIVKENYNLKRFELTRDKALEYVKENDENYKVELIEDLPKDSIISFYSQGEFTDLCAGPHVESTGEIRYFKLLSLAGAYWRGDEKNKMLQRIYGISFPKKSLLDEYVLRLEEAKKRDHRKLGRELDLFSILEEGPGFPFFHPKGMVIRNILEELWRKEHIKNGYEEIKTPIILNKDLWIRSGHWDHYQDNMYFTNIDDEEYAIKPMNCPGSMLLYKRKMHSYRDLPLRIGELGLVHRHELSGALHGLMRVRCFTQDDAHIFMLPEQIQEEISNVIDLVDYFYKKFDFKYHVELSTKPESAMGSDEDWDKAIVLLKKALDDRNIDYIVNEGDGAFYGPKIDFHLEDSIGRTWQCGTIQLDFQMPELFDLTYIGSDGDRHRPAMIHRVVYGSIERFIGILIEHYAGAFPAWLAPVQIKLLSINDRSNEYIMELSNKLKDRGYRLEHDLRNEKIGYKIREAQLQKIPYMIVIGDKEVENNMLSVRSRDEGPLGNMSYEEFINLLQDDDMVF